MTDNGTFDDDKVHQWLAEIAATGWVSLHYETPGLMGLGRGEIAGGGYQRQLATFTVPAGRAIWSTEDLRFTGLLANRLTHFGVWDAKHDGTLCAYGPLPNDVLVRPGGAYVIKEGDLALSFA